VHGLKAFCSLSDYFGDAGFAALNQKNSGLKQLLIFIRLWRILRATSAGVYFPKYSNVVHKKLSIHPVRVITVISGTRH
jgi:hypothetical protein